MVKIFLRAGTRNVAGVSEDCLHLSDSNGNSGINDLRTEVTGGLDVSWELEKPSGIKSIEKIWVKGARPEGKIFKKEPRKGFFSSKFGATTVIPPNKDTIEDKYNIKYILDDGRVVTIDPFIRIKPPS